MGEIYCSWITGPENSDMQLGKSNVVAVCVVAIVGMYICVVKEVSVVVSFIVTIVH